MDEDTCRENTDECSRGWSRYTGKQRVIHFRSLAVTLKDGWWEVATLTKGSNQSATATSAHCNEQHTQSHPGSCSPELILRSLPLRTHAHSFHQQPPSPRYRRQWNIAASDIPLQIYYDQWNRRRGEIDDMMKDMSWEQRWWRNRMTGSREMECVMWWRRGGDEMGMLEKVTDPVTYWGLTRVICEICRYTPYS